MFECTAPLVQHGTSLQQAAPLEDAAERSDVPPSGVVEAQKLSVEPPAVTKNDVELHKEEEADTGPEPKAKPKHQQSRRQRQGRRRPKQRHQCECQVHDQAERAGAGSASDPLGSQGSASGVNHRLRAMGLLHLPRENLEDWLQGLALEVETWFACVRT